jgi:hypothetical protein
MQLVQTKVERPALRPTPVCHVVSLIEGTPPPKKVWLLVRVRFSSRNVGPTPAEKDRLFAPDRNFALEQNVDDGARR